MNKVSKKYCCHFLTAAITLVLFGCGGGGSGSNTTAVSKTGVLTDDPIAGIAYTTSSGSSGITNEFGEFNFKTGENITLTLASQKITLPATERITPTIIAQALADQATKTATLADDYSEQELQLAEAQLAYYFQNIDTDKLPGVQSNTSSQTQFIFPTNGLGKGPLLTSAEQEVSQDLLLSALAHYYGNELQGVWTLIDVKTNGVDNYNVSDQSSYGAKLYISQNLEGNSAIYTQYNLSNALNSPFKTAATALNILVANNTSAEIRSSNTAGLETSISEYTPNESDGIDKFNPSTAFSFKDGLLTIKYTNAANQTIIEKYSRESQSGKNSGSYLYLGMEYAETETFSEYGSCVSEDFFELYCYDPTSAAGSVGPVVQTFLDNGYLLTTVLEQRVPRVILSRIAVSNSNVTINSVINASSYNQTLLDELRLNAGSTFNLYTYNAQDITDEANAACFSIASEAIRSQCITANKAYYTQISTQLLDFDYIAPNMTIKSQYFYSVRMPDKATQVKLLYLNNKAGSFLL